MRRCRMNGRLSAAAGMFLILAACSGHLHAPGVTTCPQMGDGPVM